MSQSSCDIKIRQLLYYKAPPSTTIPSHRATNKLQTLDHKLGKTKYTTNYTLSETRPFFENFMVKSEQTQSFGFRLPFTVEEHENAKTQIHFLEVFTHSQVLVENYISDCKRTLANLKEQSSQIRNEMALMKQKKEAEIESIEQQFQQAVEHKTRQLKEDYVEYATESFRLNKEIRKLMKEKMQLEMNSMDALGKVVKLEKQLQGVDMGLQCDNELDLQNQLKGTFNNTKSITH